MTSIEISGESCHGVYLMNFSNLFLYDLNKCWSILFRVPAGYMCLRRCVDNALCSMWSFFVEIPFKLFVVEGDGGSGLVVMWCVAIPECLLWSCTECFLPCHFQERTKRSWGTILEEYCQLPKNFLSILPSSLSSHSHIFIIVSSRPIAVMTGWMAAIMMMMIMTIFLGHFPFFSIHCCT